jgi:NAD(P) transhydrogenase subunit alpha
VAHILGCVAVTTATINVVGGFGITDRMLKMFGKRKDEGKKAPAAPSTGASK